MWDDVESKEILVVDDVPANLKVLSEILSSAHYGVAAVASGKRALNRLQNYLPDLILLDIQMPEIDGFETCRQIKCNPDTAHIPIIFITALSDVDSIAKGFALGAVDYISKPFQDAELLARVKTHLSIQSFTQQLERQVSDRTADLYKTLEELENSKLRMVQQEKMSALGNLVAGVAHEVNNPLGFLTGSVSHAEEYLCDLLGHLDLYQKHVADLPDVIRENEKKIDLNFLCEDFPKLLESMQMANERIQNISDSLRIFSRADSQQAIKADIHDGLDSTLLILKYRLKADEKRPDIQVVKEYGDIPLIDCFPGQLNQVFMNILVNAVDMFDEAACHLSFESMEANPQVITIQTENSHESNSINIRIRDNGKGMSQEIREKASEYLFTTKAVGKGTGLGLAIAHQIVIETHGGSLNIQSELGQGTEFLISIPLCRSVAACIG